MSEMKTLFKLSADLNEVEQPPLLPKGKYLATIRQAGGKLSARDNYYAEVMFHISTDQYPVDYDASISPDGLELAYRRVPLESEDHPIDGKQLWTLKNFVTTIGAPLSNEIDLNEWIGLTAVVEVDHETYEGIDREVIKKVYPES